MTARRFIYQQVSEAIARGAVVLTPNERSARTLRRLLAIETGNAAPILSLAAWTSAEWQKRIVSGQESRVPLTPAQEMRLWEETVTADAELQTLLPASRLAEMANQAAGLLHTWGARKQLRPETAQADPAVFLRWLQRFEERCKRSQWISSAEVTNELANALQTHSSDVFPEIVFAGFDQFNPSQQMLFEALHRIGARASKMEPAPAPSNISLAVCNDLTDEAKQCAYWAAKQVQEGRRVAIIHPDPASVRPALERALRDFVAPYMNDVGRASTQAPYEFSLGVPLRSTLFVRHALLLLRWLSGPLDIEQVSELLRSPYLGAKSTAFARAEFDAFGLRQSSILRREISVEAAVALMRERRFEHTRWPLLTGYADVLEAAAQKAMTSTSAGWMDWADHATRLLSVAGWQSAAHDDSYTFQLRQRWQEMVEEFAHLQAFGDRVPWQTALRMLDTLAARTLFAPESHDAPVQVMGPLEAAASEFDALWFMGADDMHWPAASSTNPLLPYFLQREAGMPGTHADSDFERYAVITERLLRSAEEVVVSYAQTTSTGERARCSSLIRHRVLSPFIRNEEKKERPEVQAVLEEVTDHLPPLASSKFTGGAQLLQAEAACPFRAFAEHRLFAAEPEANIDGMDAAERGNVLHRILEHFWRDVKTQRALAEMGAEGRAQKLQSALYEELNNSASAWEQGYLQLEQERLFAMLSRWLEMELKRSPFVVEDIERKIEGVPIGPLHLDLRVDRIDRVSTPAGEGLLLIDYKTGQASPADWEGERPDAPQLPLYAAVADAGVAGIAFANLKPGEKGLALQGISGIPGMLGTDDEGTEFPEKLPEWHHALTLLAHEFAEGDAEVNPKRFPDTCRYCRQHLLCRVHESAHLAEDDVEEEEA